MKKNNKEKIFYRNMISELIKIADELTTNSMFNIKPGTYRAIDIHRLMKKKDEDYLDRFRFLRSRWEEEAGTMDDIRAPRTFHVENCSITIPRVHVFNHIKYYERLAGLTGKAVQTWTFHDERDVVISSPITFASKKVMKELSTFVKQNNRPDGRYTTLYLSDGCLRGTICEFEYDTYLMRFNKRKIVGLQSYIHNTSDFIPMLDYKDLAFRITADDLKHLYGTCHISLYIDKITSESEIFLRHPRIVIENESGWCISSDIIENLDNDKNKDFDNQFSKSYDNDYLSENLSRDESSVNHTSKFSDTLASEAGPSYIQEPIHTEDEFELANDIRNAPMPQNNHSRPQRNEEWRQTKVKRHLRPGTYIHRNKYMKKKRRKRQSHHGDDRKIYLEHSVKKLTISRYKNE